MYRYSLCLYKHVLQVTEQSPNVPSANHPTWLTSCLLYHVCALSGNNYSSLWVQMSFFTSPTGWWAFTECAECQLSHRYWCLSHWLLSLCSFLSVDILFQVPSATSLTGSWTTMLDQFHDQVHIYVQNLLFVDGWTFIYILSHKNLDHNGGILQLQENWPAICETCWISGERCLPKALTVDLWHLLFSRMIISSDEFQYPSDITSTNK